MLICKTFATMAAAEQFQDALYDQYDSVKLVRFPHFSEDGAYAWEVVRLVQVNFVGAMTPRQADVGR